MPVVSSDPAAGLLPHEGPGGTAHRPGAPGLAARVRDRLATRAAVPFGAVLGRRSGTTFGILMYHRIAECPADGVPPTWNVEPHRFRAQLEGLLRRGYQPWPLRRVLEHSRAGKPVPCRTFVVTFDDGYESVYRHAWPVLRELGVPATVFLATAYLDSDGPFPCDDWPRAGSPHVPVDSWRPLSTRQCLEMQAGGLVELGAHTHTHADFRGRPEALFRDLQVCLGVLWERFGISAATFAFPYGKRSAGYCGPPLTDAARRARVLCSLTTERELVVPGSDPFDWGRFTVENWDTPATLIARLDGWYSHLQDMWRWMRARAAGAGAPGRDWFRERSGRLGR